MKQKIRLITENAHVLIVEDHELVKKGFVTILGVLFPKAVVHTPSSVAEVKKLLDTEVYDAILLDNNLRNFPDGETCKGIDLIPLIREKCSQAKIIFTSLDRGVGEILLKEQRIDAFVSKENLLDVL